MCVLVLKNKYECFSPKILQTKNGANYAKKRIKLPAIFCKNTGKFNRLY
ncbi:hypothetical protein HMPREF0027_1015 [Actinobacillus ureae ATCC 25976]|uniref:Uncharacterized protein n=1 Tax=Actinobacillus ureae ATCC 25976 TaxID=887324 RepID=E8KGP8_9PAST|nr:hypothetical protein HMPREF0027_1015 [Actinobacillus ureae ATCC 25976]